MSGLGEVLPINDLIGGTIKIIKSTKSFYSTVKDVKGQPREFQTIAAKFPLAIEILEAAKKHAEATTLDENVRRTAQETIESCTKKVQSLQRIFTDVIRHDDDNYLERYKKAIIAISNGTRAELLMKEVMEHIQLVTCGRLMGTATGTQIEDLGEAIKELLELSLSTLGGDRSITLQHTGSGHNNNVLNRSTNSNSTGVQQVNNGGGTHTVNVHNHSAPENSTTSASKFLQSLAFREMHSRENDIMKPVEGTCQWLWGELGYKDWLEQNTSLLWIIGVPGSGKSTLIKYICRQDILENHKDDTQKTRKKLVVASFFCHRTGDNPLQKNRFGLFRSLLHQILREIPILPPEITLEFEKRCESRGTYGEKWEWNEDDIEIMLYTSISYIANKYPDEYVVRIYVDALDEFSTKGPNSSKELDSGAELSGSKELDSGAELSGSKESSTGRQLNDTKEPKYLARYFEDLMTSDMRGIDLNVCISCHDYPCIAGDGFRVSIEHQNWPDIMIYARHELGDLRGDRHEAEKLVNWIAKSASGIFQWAVVVIDEAKRLNETIPSPQRIFEKLKHLPQGLDNLYDRSFESMDVASRLQSLWLLRWICFAERPLSVKELYDVITFDQPGTDRDINYKTSHSEMAKTIESSSRNLAIIHKHQENYTVQPRHQSVRDYLLSRGQQYINDNHPNAIYIGSALTGCLHLQILQSCVDYLTSNRIRRRYNTLLAQHEYTTIDHESSSNGVEDSEDGLPFSRYVALHWAYHAKLAEDEDADQECSPKDDPPKENIQKGDLLKLLYLRIPNTLFEELSVAAAKIQYGDMETDMTLLHIASHHGLLKLAEAILETTITSIATSNERPSTVYKTVAKLLHKAPNIRHTLGLTPLTLAIQGKHEAIVKLLLTNHTTDVNAVTKSGRGNTPLMSAVECGQKGIVELLLQCADIDINAQNTFGFTALLLAVMVDHKEIVALLLQNRNTDINGAEMTGTTPLSFAVRERNQWVVSELLKRDNINVSARNKFKRSALDIAIATKHWPIVELLLNAKKRMNKADKKFAQVFEGLSLDERNKMSDDMKQSGTASRKP